MINSYIFTASCCKGQSRRGCISAECSAAGAGGCLYPSSVEQFTSPARFLSASQECHYHELFLKRIPRGKEKASEQEFLLPRFVRA